jgi:hypothetical protein
MAKIQLSVVCCHGFRFTTGPKRGEGGPMVIAEFSAPWTERNREAGGWEEIPETVSGNVNLVPGELAAQHIEFVPGNGLEKHAFSIDVSSATDFQCFIPTKEGEERELRFKVKTAAKDAGRILDTFGRTCGEASGKLRLSYDADAQTTIEEAQQEELPLKGEALAAHQSRQAGKKKDVQ